MAGTLTTSAGATSFRFLTGDNASSPSIPLKSASNLSIRCRNRKGKSPKASLHAVIDEPLVESTKAKSVSLYDVLNVNRNATISEIKSAYRRLAKRYHPDACGAKKNNGENDDDDRDFVEICNAYVTLSDPRARAMYDMKMRAGLERRSGGLYAGAGKRSEFYAGRRWETDQCW